MMETPTASFVATRNACKLCSPLGACMVLRGIEGAVPLLHGSQGCATYIRRYVISHFKEPVDVASSNFSEASAIFGGAANLKTAIRNIVSQYHPTLIGVATTCLSETMGEDVPMLLHQCRQDLNNGGPVLLHVSTPSYRGTHMDGFHAAVRAAAEALAESGPRENHVNVFPGMVSPADLRYLKEVLADFGLAGVLLPDYSDTLDGPTWDEYRPLSPGGTPLKALRLMAQAQASIEFGPTLGDEQGAGSLLQEQWGVPNLRLGLPIGIRQTDRFFEALASCSGQTVPEKHAMERGRLIDSYVDGHKYVFGKRAIVYGEEDLVVSMAAFLAEIGIVPVLCASGGESGRLEQSIRAVVPQAAEPTVVRQGADFAEVAEAAEALHPDILIGSSKGYPIARRLGVPLVRVGFPIHDRLGGQRIAHLGYRGTQQLFDRIANTLIAHKQDGSSVGYSYM